MSNTVNIAMFSFVELILQLRQKCPSFSRRIGGSAEFIAKTTPDSQFKVPYLFCLPLSQSGGEIDRTAGTQDRKEVVAIIVCLDNVDGGGESQGKAAVRRIDEVGALQMEIEKAMYLWEPSTFNFSACPQFLQRVPMGMTNTRIWFQLEFSFMFQVNCNYFMPREVAEWAETADAPRAVDITKISAKYDVTEEEVRSLDDNFFAAPYDEQGVDAGLGGRQAFDAEARVSSFDKATGVHTTVSDGTLMGEDDDVRHGEETKEVEDSEQ